ncbi:hypothetical protein GS610_10165 [Ruegeria sp. HKCCD6228]|uniref:SPW repeat-containing protein n=2 Tax=Ruegeria TaxID=97050 RepID=A0AA90YUM7_9RHOB|nr:MULTISPECIES: hypothetical protein [Ruegeria]NOC83072.1 hypothetical protein [Ruegeria sp. HKCCD6428]NOC93836.1 hypothetical protein [Ruegeria sp. HKCCD6604]NOD97574.1 hypothetical protein [Ruegeria sp. HKCCD6228]NOE19561.1 hypothetical protein [Ruegeria atlantica]
MRKPIPPHKWLLAAMGIWLVLSPFVLFREETLLQGMAELEAIAFMATGIVVLVMSGADGRSHLLARVAPVSALGFLLIAAPTSLSFTGHIVATANAWLTGSALIALVVWEVMASRGLRAIS